MFIPNLASLKKMFSKKTKTDRRKTKRDRTSFFHSIEIPCLFWLELPGELLPGEVGFRNYWAPCIYL